MLCCSEGSLVGNRIWGDRGNQALCTAEEVPQIISLPRLQPSIGTGERAVAKLVFMMRDWTCFRTVSVPWILQQEASWDFVPALHG